MITFHDDYEPETRDIFGDGTEYITLEPDRAILVRRRKQLGLTQQQVADAAHIQLRQYQRLESGERSMASASLRIGLSVCAVLQLDPRRFVFVPQQKNLQKL